MNKGKKLTLFIGILVSIFFGNCNILKAQDLAIDNYLPIAEVMPEPIGGLEKLNTMISYPDEAKSAHLEGKVFVLAFINEFGTVDDVKLIKGIGMGCENEVMKAVKKTKFTPAYNKGVAVKAKLPIAFQFKLH